MPILKQKNQRWWKERGGGKEEPLNYRPISLILLQRKIMEYTINQSFFKCKENKMIINRQHGFVKEMPCLTILISLPGKLMHLVDGGSSGYGMSKH